MNIRITSTLTKKNTMCFVNDVFLMMTTKLIHSKTSKFTRLFALTGVNILLMHRSIQI